MWGAPAVLDAQPFISDLQFQCGDSAYGWAGCAASTACIPCESEDLIVDPAYASNTVCRAHHGHLHPGQMDDPRLTVRVQSVEASLKSPGGGFHAILFNLECALPRQAEINRSGLPKPSFLNRAHSALKEGGLLAVCCSVDPAATERRLRQAGFDVARESVPSSHKGKQKRRSTIWLARKGVYQSHARGQTTSTP